MCDIDIPLFNLIGFASDNASVMLGKQAGLAALLKKDVPWIAIFGGICHSFALCSATACDILDPEIVQFAHDVYNFVAYSPKRKSEFAECQKFVEVAEHAILYPSKTRWLAMEHVVKRLLEQCDDLKKNFQSMIADNISTAVSIHEGLGNVKLRLFFLPLLGFILVVVNELNLEFQK